MKQLFCEGGVNIIGAILFVVIIVCWAGCLAGGVCATHNCKKEGRDIFDQMSVAKDADWKVQSKRDDIYYKSDPHAIIGPNPCFYNDGSLRYDSGTKKTYKKGQYQCDSYGLTADCKKAPSDMKRPPKI